MKALSLQFPLLEVSSLKKYYIILFTICSSGLFAQDFSIKGKVAGADNQQPLESATVYVNNTKDLTLVTYTISDKNGNFELEGRTKAQQLDLLVSFVGYKTYKKKIRTSKKTLDLGTILMELQAEELEGVDVVAMKAPITVKKDTLEFNADSFKLQPDSSVEELLKRLPGVEVGTDGKITVNGKPVNEVLVNGKPFFNDPKIATKNLTKDIVDKIQISDTKTESEKFTGEKADGKNKSINIKLKEGKDKGYFGRVTGGYGTDERYEGSTIINYFNGARRISLLGSRNNINSAGFEYSEVFDAMKGGDFSSISVMSDGSFSINGNQFGGGQGISTSTTLGLNFVDELAKNQDVSGNYFYSANNSENHTKVKRENFLPNRHFFTESNSSFEGDSDSHRVSTRFKFEIDSTFQISLRPSFSYAKGQNHNESNEVSFDESNMKINESESLRNAEDHRKGFSNKLSLTKKFGTKGAFLSVVFDNDNSTSESNSTLYNKRQIYGTSPSTDLRNQNSDAKTTNASYYTSVIYRLPLTEKLFLNTTYTLDWKNEINFKNTYDADASGKYNIFNKPLSSDFENKNISHVPTITLDYREDKFSAKLGGGLAYTKLFNEDKLHNVSFEKDFSDVDMFSNIRYEVGQGSEVSLRYSTESTAPSARQLQPIENINNPLHTYVGNPYLKREFKHNLSLDFNRFDFKTQSGIFFYTNMEWTQDKITPITTTDADLLRRTTYTNLSGDFYSSLYGTYRKTIKMDKNRFTYSFGLGGAYSDVNQYLNEVLFNYKSVSVRPRIGFTYNIDKLLDNDLKYSLAYSTVKYSIPTLQNQSYASHNINLTNTLYLPGNIVFGNDITYNYNPQVVEGFDKSIILWNMSLGVKMFKEQAILKLKSYDLLDQNSNVRRVVKEDYIQDSESTILKRYFMLSFTYKWNSMKKPSLKEEKLIFF